jgi:hypothetical protein
MSTITSLWAEETLPIRDGLYAASGESYSLRLNPAVPCGAEITGTFDLDAFLESDPDWLTTIDITGKTALPNDSGSLGSLVYGEGSHGSEGFFGRLDKDQNLAWVLYLEESNPFVKVTVNGQTATFTSSSDIAISVNIDHPWTDLPQAPK